MKKIITILVTAVLAVSGYAQVPDKMGYQAVIRDASDALLTNTTVGMQISILEGSAAGTAVYVETHSPTTNDNGLMVIEVGTGSVVLGDFSTIDWGGNSYFIKTETDPTGGTSYTIVGTSQLMSVPYAFLSKNAVFNNTLNEAYNENGSGSGRIITADGGKVEINATGNRGLEITGDPLFTGLYVTGATALDQTAIYGFGSGDAYGIWGSNTGTAAALYGFHSGAGNALDIFHSGTGVGIDIENTGIGRGIHLLNSNPTNAFEALKVDNNGLGGAVWIDNLAGGGSFGLAVDQAGAGNAVIVNNTGTGIGIAVANTNAAGLGEALKVFQTSPTTALFVDNAGTAKGVDIFNGNPAGTGEALKVTQVGSGTGLFLEIAGVSKGAEILAISPTNDKTVLFAGTMGTGSVASFLTDDNNAAMLSTLQALNMGAGRVAEFRTVDEMVGKVNSFPTLDIISNGKGSGVNVDIINDAFGTDANSEPAIYAIHRGYGKVAFFENDKSDNFDPAVEIINKGAGYGLHIDSFDNPSVNVETALYVEQGNSSTASVLGRVAVFDLHPAGTSADSAVLIRSSATSGSSSALRVIAASTANLAGVFEGDVEISSDLTVGFDVAIGGTMSATTKLFVIDHPLDPDNKYLIHNSIESNERINIYSGNITTNVEGYATVQLPDYMCALNKDFKYQLTILDKTFAQAIIWEGIDTLTNSFIIKTDTPGITVSWQITGTRQDTWALENPMKVEVDKNSEF